MLKKVKNTVECVVRSLDGWDAALHPFLPYLLQDLWEIGSSADHIIRLIKKHRLDQEGGERVLDLGCGKGAIAIPLAREFGFKIRGFDAMPHFVEEARKIARTSGVESQCRFEIEDIRSKIRQWRGFFMVILGSIGPVLGSVEKTLCQVKRCVTQNGYIILDDAYIPDESTFYSDTYLKRSRILEQINRTSLRVVDEFIMNPSDVEKSDDMIFKCIQNRAAELSERYPQNRQLFTNYLAAQEEENMILENEVVCATWLLKRA